MARLASSMVGMIVSLIHRLTVIADTVRFPVRTMGNAVSVCPAIACTAGPGIGAEPIAAGIMMMDILHRIAASAIFRASGMIMIFILDSPWYLIHTNHDFLFNTQNAVMNFLKSCILVDYDVLCEQCGCKKLFAITHTLKNRLNIAGKPGKHCVRTVFHLNQLLQYFRVSIIYILGNLRRILGETAVHRFQLRFHCLCLRI